jgi:RHS repeat-associated protein
MKLEQRPSTLPEHYKWSASAFRKASRDRYRSYLVATQAPRKNARTCFEGPFGEVIRATGPMAKANPLRFSTKYQDDETDLLYYGYRYYNASSGRWLSRDPSQEEGGVSLYAFATNDGIDSSDFVGLWSIERKGDSRARAFPEAGDTIQKLADKIQLDASDWKQWAKISSPFWIRVFPDTILPSECGLEVSIPNTVFIEFGEMTHWIDYVGPIARWRSGLTSLGKSYEGKGFKVVLRNPSNESAARTDLEDANIYGWAYAGRGRGGGLLAFKDDESGDFLDAKRYTRYGIHFLIAYGCATADQTPILDPRGKMHYRYSPWERNVALNGLFTGVWGVVNWYQAWTHIIQAPGTNSQ